MCWSFEVSVLFAAAEFSLLTLVWLRARRSASDPWLRGQLLLLPLMGSICLVEMLEALLWLEDKDLIPAVASSQRTCSSYNKRLTLVIFLVILPWQPFFLIAPTRRVGHGRNRDLLLGSEILSLVYAISFVGFYFAGFLIPWIGDLRRSLEESSFTGCFHTETCTFLGKHGRLHWTFGSPDTYVAPNIYTYTLLWIPVCLARPIRFSAGIILFMWSLSIFWLMYYEMSFESGSVWCWSGFLACLYFFLQPYILPCGPDDATCCSKERTKQN